VRSSYHDDVSSPNPGHSHEVTSQVKVFNEAVVSHLKDIEKGALFPTIHFFNFDDGEMISATRATIQAPAMSKNVQSKNLMTSQQESDQLLKKSS
jgi:hypothetical protein